MKKINCQFNDLQFRFLYNFKKKKIIDLNLISGAAGFIGFHVCKANRKQY